MLDQTSVAVIGGGPAGLMAAEVLVAHGVQVDVYDAMASVGRKFLIAGRGGLNLTHAEPLETFLGRYGARRGQIEPMIAAFGPEALRQWAADLGVKTFEGSSGRVFPTDMKAAPLLRAWLHRLRGAGVRFHVRHRWLGWNDESALRFATPQGEQSVRSNATVLALGGGSWPQLGSDGVWIATLAARGVEIAPLQPANSGFDVPWSEHLRGRFAGQPVKPVIATTEVNGALHSVQGEFVITENGVEGGLIYALSATLRDGIAASGATIMRCDLAPGQTLQALTEKLSLGRGAHSLSEHLRRRVGITGVKAGLLREVLRAEEFSDMRKLAQTIKSLPLRLIAPRPLAEAISSAGGVAFSALDKNLMLDKVPSVFCAGEMLDWEAPTGGYLLTACFASGRIAGAGTAEWLIKNDNKNK